MSCRLNDTVRPFVANGGFSPVRQYEAIFVERMGPNNTHPEHFVRGVVEHPESDSCDKGSRAPGPDVASALYFTCRFVVYGLVVICDQMGVSVLGLGMQTLFDHAL